MDYGKVASMLLAVDIGNTNTVLGFAHADGGWSTIWRITTPRAVTADDWAATLLPLSVRDRIELADVSAVGVGSVVPAATIGLLQFVERFLGLEALLVRSDLELGITLGMENSTEVGADRIANAVAAWALEPSPAIIVDLGTATKVEALDASGTFLGGAIAPGLGVTLEALTTRAARLFPIELRNPESAIGRNTVQAMQAGIVRGHLHLVRGLIADLTAELGADARLILTGGHAPSLLESFEAAVHVPNLTLDGIRLIHQRNRLCPST